MISLKSLTIALLAASAAPQLVAAAFDSPYTLAPATLRSVNVAMPGPYDQPYVLFEAAPRSALRNIEPATIMRVDDEPSRGRRSEPLPAGLHAVEVSIPARGRGMGRAERRTIVVDARACTRYYIGAHRQLRGSRDWEAVVDRVKPIGECEARFLR